MFSIKCIICGENFESDLKGVEYAKLGRHIKKNHAISTLDYTLKFITSEHPLCACGCGEKVKFKKWKFDKYYLDHKNKVKTEAVVVEKIVNSILKRRKTRYSDLGLSKEDLINSFELYKTEEYNQDKLSNKYGVDFRVLKKYWILLDIAKKSAINRYARMHKGVWSNQGHKNGQYQPIENEILDDIYNFLKNSDKKVTFQYLKEMFSIKHSSAVLKKRLYEKFGKENIKQYMILGTKSHEEVNFGFVLKYYFGDKNVKQQFLLKRKIYDFLIFNRLIIEYDGLYWHQNTAINDEEKNKIALENGYVLYRVSDKRSKNIEILVEIQKILKNLGVLKDEI